MNKSCKKIVILAEDTQVVALTVKKQLEKFDIEVLLAKNGHEVLDRVKSSHNLIIMDRQMPGMNGIECTKILRSQGYDKPIIAHSSSIKTDDIKNWFEAGADGLLRKPCQLEEMIRKLEKYF